MRLRCIAFYSTNIARILYSRLCSTDHLDHRRRDGAYGRMGAWMGHSGFPVIIHSRGIILCIRGAIVRLNQA